MVPSKGCRVLVHGDGAGKRSVGAALLTGRCGYAKFRTPSVLVHPVFRHALKPSRRAAIVRLERREAELLYRWHFANVEFFPADIDAVLSNDLSLGTFLALPSDRGGRAWRRSWRAASRSMHRSKQQAGACGEQQAASRPWHGIAASGRNFTCLSRSRRPPSASGTPAWWTRRRNSRGAGRGSAPGGERHLHGDTAISASSARDLGQGGRTVEWGRLRSRRA